MQKIYFDNTKKLLDTFGSYSHVNLIPYGEIRLDRKVPHDIVWLHIADIHKTARKEKKNYPVTLQLTPMWWQHSDPACHSWTSDLTNKLIWHHQTLNPLICIKWDKQAESLSVLPNRKASKSTCLSSPWFTLWKQLFRLSSIIIVQGDVAFCVCRNSWGQCSGKNCGMDTRGRPRLTLKPL